MGNCGISDMWWGGGGGLLPATPHTGNYMAPDEVIFIDYYAWGLYTCLCVHSVRTHVVAAVVVVDAESGPHLIAQINLSGRRYGHSSYTPASVAAAAGLCGVRERAVVSLSAP